MLFSFLLVCTMGFSQTRKAVSILGDSYSTFENYLQPDTNAVWYFQQPRKNNDVRSVDQTWWYKFIKESGYRLCVNNSFSGQFFLGCNHLPHRLPERGLFRPLVCDTNEQLRLSGYYFHFWSNK